MLNTLKKEVSKMNEYIGLTITTFILQIVIIGVFFYALYENNLKHNKQIDAQIEDKIDKLIFSSIKTTNSILELKENNVDYKSGYNEGLNEGVENLTPKIIEKAYQLGINDSDKIKAQRKLLGDEWEKGNKICIDIPSPEVITKYVLSDDTVQTEPFVNVGCSLEEYLRVPKGIKIRNLKILDTVHHGKYGRYTVYKTSNGKCIHLKKGCSGAKIPELSFANNGRNWYLCCDKCFPAEKMYLLNVPEWYKDFRNYKEKHSDAPFKPSKFINSHKITSSYESDFEC